ncbi:2-hydroxyacyl-CoA dehydratase family protein [Sphingomonas sp. SUN039]|uniref:2-hydroxyacyl-CoA dehydratase family protein n=1 Tax=Sphingomonas sp. SUN039 TaxID=2937787 RepID=UPI0021641ED3|nr:2-hydroxyacyl-CoA dehydratase family protein [Sphingomonas sp. SUN039]UVO54386.1 2-hydroxyacyl-CoA dehydratase family protein [Sphingomonas sp. SUN039]
MSGIAKVGADVPLDVLLARGDYRGHLPWDVDAPTPVADRWLESSFAPWHKSILESWATGAFDDLDTVVFTRGEDSTQRLYYYIRELQRRGELGGPEAVIFDIARVERASSAARTVHAVRKLAEQLGIDEDALERGIAAANAQRTGAAAPASDRRTCLLAGTPQPDLRLHLRVAAAGWHPVGPTLADVVDDAGPAVATNSDDPATAIAAQLRDHARSARAFRDHAAVLRTDVAAAQAQAVVIWLIEEEEAMLWELPAQVAALDADGIPVLQLTRRRWDATDGAGDDIAAFLASLA